MKLIEGPIKGYKAMNDDMTCRGFKFEIGKTYEIGKDEPLEVCRSGFHFCQQPSGVWVYYSTGRLFEVEAYDVLETEFEVGADYKQVCRRLKIVREIQVGGNYNTGNYNTGDYNTGYCNAGYRNTGNYNTGNYNTGDYNTGYRNTGDCNTGNYNTGNRNTGDYNVTDYSTGYFCIKPQPVILFDKKCDIERGDIPFALMHDLQNKLEKDDKFDIEPFLAIPNATKAKIKALHKKHKELRSLK